MRRRSERAVLHRMSQRLLAATCLGYLSAMVVEVFTGGIGDRNASAVAVLALIGFVGAGVLEKLSVRRRP